ncbi:MAG: single-stranded DNA-binding protein, partial [Glaciimonas sp.]|nr:single-stranded DNA-binding protein [Glaciimonas sp.]
QQAPRQNMGNASSGGGSYGNNSNSAPARPAQAPAVPRPAPNFSDMDDDIPF